MPINLKQIFIPDSDSIKLDKVNYNFDQLVANGGGPRGPQGAIGQTGPQGTTGKQGVQGVVGDIGNQGPIGIISPDYWKRIPNTYPTNTIDVDTLIPVVDSTNIPPVVNIGYLENDPEYNINQPLVNGKNPFQWNIHRKNFSASNLRFLNGDKYVDWRLEKKEDQNRPDQMTLGFIDSQNSINLYQTGQMGFQGTTTSPYSFAINQTAATFNANTNFNLPVSIKRNLFIRGAGAGIDKVATCMDSTGLLKFKTVAELPGTVPIGTIVSLMPSIFNNNNSNFINTEYISVPSSDKPLNISVGKGVGTYVGWYLCNGETWTNGTNNYPVPMLGDFNYSIDDNPLSSSTNGQGTVTLKTTTTTHITGGSDINMAATPALSVYTITSTINTSSVQVDPGTGTTSTFKIKQLPQIIYLGKNNLYWSNKGEGQSPAVPLTWRLDDQNTSASKLNPDPYPLGVTDDRFAGQSYPQQFEVTAPYGYYWETLPATGNISGLPSYVESIGIAYADSGAAFPTTIILTISVNGHPEMPALPATGITATLGINTSGFISPPATASINLYRSGDPVNVTPNTPAFANQPISYNFTTGYDFALEYTANTGYTISPNSFLFLYGNPTNTVPPTGGGSLTVSSYTLSPLKTILTINIRLNGIPTTGYLSQIIYRLVGITTLPQAPQIVPNFSNGYAISGVHIGNVSKTFTVRNNTGSTVWIWNGIEQLADPFGQFPTQAAIQGNFISNSPSFQLQVSADTIIGTTYSANYHILANGSTITGDLIRNATNDKNHTVRLWYSLSKDGQKFIITP